MTVGVAGVTVMVIAVMLALPDLEESSVDVATSVAAPAWVGVKTPAEVIDPALDGFTDQFTALLKLPVPATVAVAVAVCDVVIAVGFTATVTPVIVGCWVTVPPPPPPHPTSSAHSAAPDTPPQTFTLVNRIADRPPKIALAEAFGHYDLADSRFPSRPKLYPLSSAMRQSFPLALRPT
jgi:hypothetical protein